MPNGASSSETIQLLIQQQQNFARSQQQMWMQNMMDKFASSNTLMLKIKKRGEVNVQQEALQSFLQTAELLPVQSEEKEKPKPPTPVLDDQKLMKSIPSTIRAVNDATAATQTIDIPLLQPATQLQIPNLQTQTATVQNTTQHHIQTQLQHITSNRMPAALGDKETLFK
ncbi:uncharacterized protein [Musca autumnalis]|uniref:uncharacterized protein n=1 Tax=Musca autumnalis TaxID=221902 RepID=UPI003CEF1BC8